jgi:hypothetical protein
MLIISARAGASIDDVVALVSEVDKQPADQYQDLYAMHNAFFLAGRYAEAAQLLDKAVATLGDKAPKNDVAAFHFKHAEYGLRGPDPKAVAEALKVSLTASADCGDACKDVAAASSDFIGALATMFHAFYAVSMDERYYEASRDLYATYAGLPGRADAADKKKLADELEQTKKNAKPGTGTHNADMIGRVLKWHDQEAQACYEAFLQGDATLAGAVKLTLEIGADGAVTGATTDPAAGKDGLAGVAGCITERARSWTFPSRTMLGKTRAVYPYAFSVAPPPAAAPAE